MNFQCTTAAFTVSHEPAGFVIFGSLAQILSLVCGFCTSARTFAFRLPPHGPSRDCSCLKLVQLSVDTHTVRTERSGSSVLPSLDSAQDERGVRILEFSCTSGCHQQASLPPVRCRFSHRGLSSHQFMPMPGVPINSSGRLWRP